MHATSTTHADRLTVTWSDGSTAEYHHAWLRDNCLCPECRHPDAWERLYDTAAMPSDITPRSVTVSDRLEIVWHDGHTTSLSGRWLRAHRYGPEGRRSRVSQPVLWDFSIADAPPEIEYAEIVAGDNGLLRWLHLIRDFGFSIVRDVPTAVDTVLDLAANISFIQESNFGRTFHVISKREPENLAYTSHRLNAHSDIPNRHSAVNLQFLHCLQFDAEGGESLLVDGFEAARRFKETNPDDYALLAAVEVPWRFQDAGTDIRNHAPVLDVDGDGRLRRIRFHTAIMDTLDIDAAVMGPYYAAIRAFGRAVRDPDLEYAFKMSPGDCQVFDNTRVLHGRAEFNPASGTRRLQGCYIDRDDFAGRLRALERHGADFRAT